MPGIYMTFYSDMAATANALIAEFGAPITLKRKTAGTLDKVTGIETGATTSTLTPNGLVTQYKANVIDGTRIQGGDRLVILDNSQTPVMTDQVLVGVEYWNIVDIVSKNPAGTELVHLVQARK